jgi:diguanylate cyclase (GGDEF)-like protein
LRLHLKNQYYFISALIITFFGILFLVTHSFIANKLELERNRQITEALQDFTLSTVDKVQEAVEQLRTFSSIVIFSNDLSYQAFETYIRDYAGNSLNWQIIEWQPIIKSSERETFEQQLRQTQFPDFFIWQPDKSGAPIPAEQRDEYVVVLYMVSTATTANTIGLDLSWSEERMRSKRRARDEGGAQISGFFPLILSPQDKQRTLGFAITLPVYQQGAVPSRMQDRRKQIKGYMAAVYAIEKLIENELAVITQAGLQITIEATDEHDSVFTSEPELNPTSTSSPAFQRTVQLYGKSWVFSVTKTQHFDTNSPLIWILLPYGSIVFGVIILIFVRLLYNSNSLLVKTEGELRTALETVSRSAQFYADLSRQDPLTGLLNRRAFIEALILETERASRYQQPLALMIVDIDNFKQVNDTYGHPSGDAVLIEFAKTISYLSRTTDLLCRFGGEEFAFILLNIDKEESLSIAKRLCQEIAHHDIVIPSSNEAIRITISAGLAEYDKNESPEDLLSRADKALYKAKESGRNRVSVAVDE